LFFFFKLRHLNVEELKWIIEKKVYLKFLNFIPLLGDCKLRWWERKRSCQHKLIEKKKKNQWKLSNFFYARIEGNECNFFYARIEGNECNFFLIIIYFYRNNFPFFISLTNSILCEAWELNSFELLMGI